MRDKRINRVFIVLVGSGMVSRHYWKRVNIRMAFCWSSVPRDLERLPYVEKSKPREREKVGVCQSRSSFRLSLAHKATLASPPWTCQTSSQPTKQNSKPHSLGSSVGAYTHARCRKAVLVEKDIPLEVDAGFLTVTDLNPVDTESYEYASYVLDTTVNH